jgi:hypothetical protein
MWPPYLLCGSPDMTEEIRQRKLAVAKKILKAYQQRNSPDVSIGAKKTKKKAQ